jgi:hypothetical protein
VCRHVEVAESTVHRSIAQYGGMKANNAKRLKELEVENSPLKRLLAEAVWTRRCSTSWRNESSDPNRRRNAVHAPRVWFGLAQRRACKIVG